MTRALPAALPAALAVLVAALSACALPDVCPPDGAPAHTATVLDEGGPAGRHIHAHAHNDYEHARPLEDALAHRFTSVEADVWLRGQDVVVSHDGLFPKGTLDALYLDPLQARVDATGSVLGDGAPFTLWIDIKDGAPALLDALDSRFARYPMLAVFDADGKLVTDGAVTVILTGDAAQKEAFVARAGPRRATRDSNDLRLDDAPDARWRAYALSWGDYVAWDGHGTVDAESARRLRCIASVAHDNGRAVRMYAAPETADAWRAQLDAGLDFLSTDLLAELDAFLDRS